MTLSVDPARRQALIEAKLRALARTRLGDDVDGAETSGLPGGAALVVGDEAWVLAEDDPERSLGAALAWSLRRDARSVHLVADASAAGHLARRASSFAVPVEVLTIRGRELHTSPPAPWLPEPPLDPRVLHFRGAIERSGAETVIEHGRLLAEVRGLEVGRVVVDESGPHLEVGVGKHDREAHRMAHPEGTEEARLFDVVRQVLEYRVPDGEGHAAYHLASERWLRWVVVRHPDMVGARTLHPVPAPVVRHDLRRPAPAPAAGVDTQDRSLLVVCSAGVDTDLVPAAADAWQADGRKPRLVLCVPEGDDHRITRDLAGALAEPAEVVTVPRTWRRY